MRPCRWENLGVSLMNATHEYNFLTELRWLFSSAVFDANCVERIAAAYVAADNSARELAAKRYTRVEQLTSLRSTRAARQKAVETREGTKGELFATVEALLATLSRISLVFFPASRRASEPRVARGQALRELLAVRQDSLLRERGVRDVWQHIDERLDSHADQALDLQRFVQSRRYDRNLAARTLRLLIVDTLEIECLGKTRIAIRPVIEEIKGIQSRLAGAFDSWGERHADELSVEADGTHSED